MIEIAVIATGVIARWKMAVETLGRCARLALSVPMCLVMVCLVMAAGNPACTTSQSERAPSQVPVLGAPINYSFTDFDAKEVSSATMRGRSTLVVLVTTYDWASQLVLRRVNQTLGSFVPRINAFAVVLEPASYAVLVPQFQKSLELHFPVVMADVGSLDGAGPFAPIEYVPTVIVLDALGRERDRLKGPVTVEELTKALQKSQGQITAITPPDG